MNGSPREQHKGGFPRWGLLGVPVGAFGGALLGAIVGAFLGSALIGAAIGMALGVGIGMILLAAAVVTASSQ